MKLNRTIFSHGILAFGLSAISSQAVVSITGGTHTYSTEVNDYFEVEISGANAGSTVNFTAGAHVTGERPSLGYPGGISYIALGSSETNVTDAEFDGSFAIGGDAVATINSGTFRGEDEDENAIVLFGNSEMTIISADVTSTGDVYAQHTSKLKIMGGSFGYSLVADGDAVITSTAATFANDVEAADDSKITLQSGSFGGQIESFDSATIFINGGIYNDDLRMINGGMIMLTGTEFFLNGAAISDGDVSALAGTLTGTLANGDALNVDFDRNYNTAGVGTLTLVTVPEPSSSILMGLGALLLVSIRKR